VTIRLADDDPQTLHAATIGAAWLAVAKRILADGVASRYDGLPVREISHVTLCVERPDPDDKIIARFAGPERLASSPGCSIMSQARSGGRPGG